MTYRTVVAALLALVIAAGALASARAEIDSQQLGARYDASGSNIAFRIYSSHATRIELDLFATPYGAA